MTKFTVEFEGIVVKSQEAGSTDDHMVSRVAFLLYVEGQRKGQFFTDLKQTVGAPMSSEAIEVGPPKGYDGPFEQNKFASAARDYFLDAIGPRGKVYQFASTAHVNIEDSIVEMPRTVNFESE
jgi:hypothetical protein